MTALEPPLSLPLAAARLGVSKKTLIAEIKRGRLRFVRVGARMKIRVDDLQAYLDRREEWVSTKEPGRHTGGTRSLSRVIGFEEARKQLIARRRKASKRR